MRYDVGVKNGDALQFAIELARIAQDHKAENLVGLDLRGLSPVTDFVIIGTGSSDRQMRAVVDHLVEYGKQLGHMPLGVAGRDNAIWVLVDFVDVVFHIFTPQYRDFYDLELLWGDAPHLDWQRSESA